MKECRCLVRSQPTQRPIDRRLNIMSFSARPLVAFVPVFQSPGLDIDAGDIRAWRGLVEPTHSFAHYPGPQPDISHSRLDILPPPLLGISDPPPE